MSEVGIPPPHNLDTPHALVAGNNNNMKNRDTKSQVQSHHMS